MGRQLTTEQVLLLENLMYLSTQEPLVNITDTKSNTIGDWLNEIDMSQLDKESDYGSYITGREWKDILTAVKNDPDLPGMEIVSTHIDNASDGGGGGVSALFRNPETREAVVAFRGTASEEWKDNFTGGSLTETSDTVSTIQQQNALEWYQGLNKDDFSYITITGHSKGGNKAKYITLMDNTVDRCISFDGQGFSDEFIETYQDNIAQNQDKIINHNVNYDYVNILLNDVGERIYYEGYDIEEGGFLENHCPNTFFRFDQNGEYTMQKTDQAWEMQELDQFLNSCLRSQPSEERVKLLNLIGEIAEMGLGGNFDTNELVQLLCEGNNVDSAAYLLAYLIEYEQTQPEFSEALNSIMENFGTQEGLSFIKLIENIVNNSFFDIIFDGMSFVADIIPDSVVKKIKDLAQENGITLTEEQIRQLLGFLSEMNTYMDNIKIEKDGADKIVKSTSSDKHNTQFHVITNALSICEEEMAKYTQTLQYLSEDTTALNRNLQTIKSYMRVKRNLVIIEQRLIKTTEKCRRMTDVAREAAIRYERTEQRIVDIAMLNKLN